jgi:lipoprotein-anchoring transpeptidase ErfK/SrfK
MSHVDVKKLVEFSEGDLPARDMAAVKRHLSGCLQCRQKLNVVKAVLAPSVEQYPYPTDKLLARILSSHKSSGHLFTLRQFAHKYIKPLAAAASLVIAVGTIFFAYPTDKAPLLASSVHGNATLNDKKFVKGNKLKSGSSLATGAESVVSLEGISVKMHAGSRTTLVVKKARIDRATGMVVYDFVVNTGTIDADFNPKKVLRYTLTTPHATITSTGSRIFLQVDHDKTRLVVKDGKAIVEPAKGGSMAASQGYQYVVSSVNDDDPADGIEEYPSTSDELAQDYLQ